MSKKRKNKKAKVKKADENWDVRGVTSKDVDILAAVKESDAQFASMCGDWITKFSEEFDTDEELIEICKKAIKNLSDDGLGEWYHFADSPTDILEVDDIINEHYSVDGSDDLFRFIKKEMCGSQLIMTPEGKYLGACITTKDYKRNLTISFNTLFGVVFLFNKKGLTVVPYRNDKLMNMVYRAFKKVHKRAKSQGLINPPRRFAS